MTLTTNILLIILAAAITFLVGLVKLGINRLIKGQDKQRQEGNERVEKIRNDIKDIGYKVADNSIRLTRLETRCDMNHITMNYGRRKEDV